MSIIEKIKEKALSKLPLTLAFIRNIKPIISFKDFVLVTRFEDVEEVLSRPDVFAVTYAEKMEKITGGGNFFLGMNNTPTYTRDVSNMRLVIRREDCDDIIAPMIDRLANEIVNQAGGKIDVVKDLSRKVPARFIKEYMGIAGPSEEELIDWTTYMFEYLFFPDTSEEVDNKALAYAESARQYLDELIAVRKAQPSQSDDIISRCLHLQQSNTPGMTDLDIRNNLIGMIIGAIPTTSKCVALVIDYLLDNPIQLERAQAAAKRNDVNQIRQYVLEILRFKPHGAGIFRTTTEDYVIAKGHLRSKKVKKGTTVLALTQSAMLDGRKLNAPNHIRLDRPSHVYMHFGYGMHSCFGKYINLVQIPHIVTAILKCEDLQRAEEGDVGAMRYRGPFPSSLKTTFNVPEHVRR